MDLGHFSFVARVARFVLKDVVHHVVARGVNRRRIFRSGSDKAKYLKRFAKIADEEKVLVHGFCLMRNHVHWILTPTTSNGLARLFQRVHTWWAVVFNRKYGRTGHLFQNRYHSSPLDEKHYWEALRYVELNPKKAGLVQRAGQWKYSSARAHLRRLPDSRIALVPVETRRQFSFSDWRIFLCASDDQKNQSIRRAAASSRPCGEDEWIAGLEAEHGRRLHLSPPGRPSNPKSIAAGSPLNAPI